MSDVNVEVTPTPAAPDNPPSDLTALVSSLVEANQQLILEIGEMKGELVVLRERAYAAQETAVNAESAAQSAEAIANTAANIALDTAVQIASDSEEEETEDEDEDEDEDGDETEVVQVIEETPAAIVETPAEDTPPEIRVEKKKRYFI